MASDENWEFWFVFIAAVVIGGGGDGICLCIVYAHICT